MVIEKLISLTCIKEYEIGAETLPKSSGLLASVSMGRVLPHGNIPSSSAAIRTCVSRPKSLVKQTTILRNIPRARSIFQDLWLSRSYQDMTTPLRGEVQPFRRYGAA